ncbi:MAG TPA: S8 family serine peptidase, partial [Longimicrobiales bacterium]
VALALVAGACERNVTAPQARAPLPRAGLLASQPLVVAGSYIVTFQGPAATGPLSARVAAAGGSVDLLRGDVGIALVSSLPDSAVASIAAVPGVVSVERDQAYPMPAPLALQDPLSGVGAASASAPAQALLFAREWWLRAVHADAAWTGGVLGKSSTHVAILDSGIDYQNPDLVGRVDLARSASFVRPVRFLIPQPDGSFQVVVFSEADTIAKYFPGRNPVTDLGLHGTMVASIVSSNAAVLAGVTSGLSLMAVKACSYLFCTRSGIIRGILYATDQGADVLNISLGGYVRKDGIGPSAQNYGGPGLPPGLAYMGYFNSLMTYALSKGVTVVVAAGNSGIDLDHDANGFADFCERPGVVCVSATGPVSSGPTFNGPFLPNVDVPAFYTNYGRSAIDVAAPGGNGTLDGTGNLLSAGYIWTPCSSTSMILPICQTVPLLLGVLGTSFASPHVAAAAALIVEQVGRNPGLVKARLEQTADDLGAIGQDPYYGHGRLNVARAAGVIP